MQNKLKIVRIAIAIVLLLAGSYFISAWAGSLWAATGDSTASGVHVERAIFWFRLAVLSYVVCAILILWEKIALITRNLFHRNR